MDTSHIRLCVFLTMCLSHTSMCQRRDEEFLLQKIVKEKHLNEDFETSELSSIHAIFPPGKLVQRHTTNTSTHARYKRSPSLDATPFKLTFTAFNKTFTLTVKHYPNLLPSYTPVFIRSRDTVRQYAGENPDCFLEGQTEGRGLVALMFCDGFEGTILEGDYMYRIDPAGKMTEDMEETIVVSRGHIKQLFNDQIGYLGDVANKTRSKRGVASTTFTIEVGIFVDAAHVAKLEADGAITIKQKRDRIAALWNGVQAAVALREDLGYDITIQIKQIEFWDPDPAWFVISETSGSQTLGTFCDGIKTHPNVLPSDHYHLHTALKDAGGASGYANTPGTCVGSPCGITSVGWSSYGLVAHELGHSLGMAHDADVGCSATKGIMDASAGGSYSWSPCSKSALESFVQSADPSCLFAENVSPSLVESEVAAITLEGLFEGMTTSPDENCLNTYGTGYRFRAWYTSVDTHFCFYSNCVNTNDGVNYGVIQSVKHYLKGTYCKEGHVCSGGSDCMVLANTRIPADRLVVVEGGWSEWGAYTTTCSRSCGTGITYRERFCNNPAPLLAPFCTGSRTDATLCNTQPCAGDSSGDNDLIKERAGEVCANLIANGIIDGARYDGTGGRRDHVGLGQCEVYCNPSPDWLDRFALMPEGTPCNPSFPGATESDINGYPRGIGVKGRCARGYCEAFACDGSTSGTIQDLCGVCGGDGSTCQAVDGVYTDPIDSDTRYELVTLPVGTTQIQFYFDWGSMADHWIELYSPTGSGLFVVLYNGQFDTRSDPYSAGGTDWYYYYRSQFLYAYGPLTSEIVVKIYNQKTNTNTGITYGYSLPLASTTSMTSTSTTSTPTTSTTTSTSTSTTTTSTTKTSTTASTTPTSTTASSTTTSTTAPTTTTSTTASSTTTSTTAPTTPTSTTAPTTTTSTTASSTTTSTTTPTTRRSTTTLSTASSTTQTTTPSSTPLVTPAPSTVTLAPVTSSTASSTTVAPASSTTVAPASSTTVAPASSSTSSSSTRNCGWGFLECPNGLCIYYTQMCDGVDDCGDNTDETYIACGSGAVGLHPTVMAVVLSIVCALFICSVQSN